MSILTNLLSGGAAKLVSSVGGVIDNLHTSKEEKLELENNMRKTLEEQILITRYEEIGEEEFVESEYKDEEFSEIPGYGGIEKEGEYDDEGDKYYPPSDAGSYEEECPSGYKWCEDLRQCIDERSGCEGMMPI